MSVEVLPDPVLGYLARLEGRWGAPTGKPAFWPKTDAQAAALTSKADFLLLGGAAGSLKTSTILADLIQERDWSRMNSYFFRKTYPELEEAIEQARVLFSQTGGTYNESDHRWRWPSGASFRFRYLATEKNLYQNQGKVMSAIGIDESTHVPMKWIRYLFTRNRSTDPDLKTRVRLGTNPGNISHKDHMKIFFNSVCPHCEPDKAPFQNTLRWDAKWHDGQPFADVETGEKFSVAYILSYVRDHQLLGNRYIARLKFQNPTMAKALLEGCWKLFEGQYYDIWDYKRFVVPLQSIPMEYWQPWWTGADYGYSGSAAAGGLWTISNDVLYLVKEYPQGEMIPGPRQNVRAFAQGFYDSLCKKETDDEQPKNIEAMYLGPDSWNDRGDENPLAEQMNRVLEPHGLNFERANNDRAGGAQLLYTLMESDRIKIAHTCRNAIECIESRIHDEDEPIKVFKDKGDPLDDVFDGTLRYPVYTYLESRRPPKEERVKQRMKQMLENNKTDIGLTTAMMKHQKAMAEEDDDDVPPMMSLRAKRK